MDCVVTFVEFGGKGDEDLELLSTEGTFRVDSDDDPNTVGALAGIGGKGDEVLASEPETAPLL